MSSVWRQFIHSRAARVGAHASIAAGFLAGGAATATLAVLGGGLIAWLPFELRMRACVPLLLLLAARQLGLVPVPLPQRSQLIPSPRLDMPFPWGSLLFAGELGLGWRTVIPTALPYGLLAFVALDGTWAVALGAAAGWAVGRWVPVSIAVQRRSNGPARHQAAGGEDRSVWPVANVRLLAIGGLAALLAGAAAGAM